MKLSAVRKLKLPAAAAPLSVLGIVDHAIRDLDTYLKTAADVAFLPVPASGYIRVSLRVGERRSLTAQRLAVRHDGRLTDFYRTVLTRYIRSPEKEITSYSRAQTG